MTSSTPLRRVMEALTTDQTSGLSESDLSDLTSAERAAFRSQESAEDIYRALNKHGAGQSMNIYRGNATGAPVYKVALPAYTMDSVSSIQNMSAEYPANGFYVGDWNPLANGNILASGGTGSTNYYDPNSWLGNRILGGSENPEEQERILDYWGPNIDSWPAYSYLMLPAGTYIMKRQLSYLASIPTDKFVTPSMDYGWRENEVVTAMYNWMGVADIPPSMTRSPTIVNHEWLFSIDEDMPIVTNILHWAAAGIADKLRGEYLAVIRMAD